MNFNNTSSRNISLGIRGVGGGVGGSVGLTNSGTSSTGHPHHGVKYVYELPYLERKEICRIFDENNQWETLGGGLMGYQSSELSEFGRAFLRGASPTDALLNAWASQNHTVLELFTLFRRLDHFRAMKVIARFVDPKYHVFIRDPEVNATQELIQLDSPASPVAVIGGVGPCELKVQNNMGYHIPDSPKKMGDGTHKNNELAGAEGKDKGALAASLVESVGHLPQIPYAELLSATNNWERRNILGKGGFGTVYKGIWKNTPVAIKRMEQRANHVYVESQMKQSLGELRCLNSYRHDNILPLYGFSLEGEHPCLVYQFIVNGSLEDRLLCRHKTPPLQWHVRYQVARGVVCGIQFLHSIDPKPLIHGDIKSANILLDRNFEAKIGDFGLAREMPSANESYVKVSRVHGTRPYLPDEYLRSKKLSTKVDTYSFGIMLFEIATGQRAYEESRSKKFLRDVIEEAEGNYEPLRDIKGGSDNPDIFWHFVKVGRSCTEKLAKNRPEMVQVLKSFPDLFLSHQNTQASSIRTGSQVTGLPFLFESPYSRPASLLIPATSSTTHRLSPEMTRATSPYWLPQSQVQPGYQTPGTISTNQSIPQQSTTASNNIMKVANIQHQYAFYPVDAVRRSPLPSISTNYHIPQMVNNTNIIPGMYQQMANQPVQMYPAPVVGNEPSPLINLSTGSGTSVPAALPGYHPTAPSPVPVPPRVRKSNQQNGGVVLNTNSDNAFAVADVANVSPSPSNLAHELGKINLQASPTPTSAVQTLQQPSTSQNATMSSGETAQAQIKQDDEFLPIFLMEEKQDERKSRLDGEGSDEEGHTEWTQDGTPTAIPLITELGIKEES